MPFSAGSFTLTPSGNPTVTGSTISSVWANNTLSDVASGLSSCILKDGTQTITANQPMSGFRHTGVGNATTRLAVCYASAADVQDSTLVYLTGVNGTNTITATAAISMTAYATGQRFHFTPANTNTGATTLNLNSIGAKNVFWNGVACVGGEIRQSIPVMVTYDGTQFHICGNGFNAPTLDTHALVENSADSTKKFRISTSGVTTGNTRVLTMADNDINLSAATANTVLAGPTSGAAGNATVRALVGADGAGWVLIQRQVAANSASVDFTTGIGATFDEYELRISDLTPATDASNLLLRISEDAGVSFKILNYAWAGGRDVDAGATFAGIGSVADSSIQIGTNLSNTKACKATIRFSSPAGTSRHKLFDSDCNWEPSGNTIAKQIVGGTYTADNAAINAIRIIMSSGNITQGNLALYGLKTS